MKENKKIQLFTDCIGTISKYLLNAGWEHNKEKNLWSNIVCKKFTLIDAFVEQSKIDFGK